MGRSGRCRVTQISALDARRGTALTQVTRAIILAEALVLTGCSEIDYAYNVVTNTVHSAFYEPRHTTSSHPARATTQTQTSSGNYNEASAPKAPEQQAAAPVVVDGLSAPAVRSLLGQPAKRGGPAPGETWTYRSGTCEVQLFLFPNVSHGGMQVLDHRVSGAGTDENTKQACLRRLRDGPSS
jgi:hypothetical protein